MKKHALVKGADEIWTECVYGKATMSMNAGEGPMMVRHDMLLEPQQCVVSWYTKVLVDGLLQAETYNKTTAGEVLGDAS